MLHTYMFTSYKVAPSYARMHIALVVYAAAQYSGTEKPTLWYGTYQVPGPFFPWYQV